MIIDHSWSAACAAFWNPAGQQALLTVAHLRKGETYADLACGFQIGTSTVYRYLREALELLRRWHLRWPRPSTSPAAKRS